MFRRCLAPLSALALSGLIAAGSLSASTGASAAPKAQTFRTPGWVLTITGKQMSYGMTLTGNLSHGGRRYTVQGDWIPAGDAGGDLLRFYGVPFGTVHGLVSLATLFSTCNPNCAAARTFKLSPVGSWTLPGMTRHASVILRA